MESLRLYGKKKLEQLAIANRKDVEGFINQLEENELYNFSSNTKQIGGDFFDELLREEIICRFRNFPSIAIQVYYTEKCEKDFEAAIRYTRTHNPNDLKRALPYHNPKIKDLRVYSVLCKNGRPKLKERLLILFKRNLQREELERKVVGIIDKCFVDQGGKMG